MPKSKIKKGERPRSKLMMQSPFDSPPKRRSARRCSDGNQNDNVNVSFPEKSSEIELRGVSMRKRKRSRSELMLESPLDSPVKRGSPRRSTNMTRDGDADASFSEKFSEIGSGEVSMPKRMKLKSVMPGSQIDSPGKWKSPRRCMNGIQNEDMNGSMTGSREVSTPEQKNSRFAESMLESRHNSPVKRRSPRRCTNGLMNMSSADKSIGSGSIEVLTPKKKKSISKSTPERPAVSPVKWTSPRRCPNGVMNVSSIEKSIENGSMEVLTPKRKKSISKSTPERPAVSPAKWTSPRRITNGTQTSDANGILKDSDSRLVQSPKSPRRRLLDHFPQKPRWNPRDSAQMNAVKEALHVSTAPSGVLCREEEQKRVFEFCKACIEHEKAGSSYICGCPGTGKTLSMEKVKEQLLGWAKERGLQPPDVLAINCTSLTATSDIFSKIFERYRPRKKINGTCLPLQHLQNLFSQKKQGRMMLVFVDEMDYLITKDRSVLHDLFMLTTFPFSTFILIGIANAIDLADRFLPKLQSLNCKPMVVTFRAYSKEQILRILQQRLMALAYDSFQPQALELCARKVAAASGDMRKALSVCRSAIEMLEADLRDLSAGKAPSAQLVTPASELLTKQEMDVVRVDHMALALSKTFKSVIVDTIQSLPQHQQILLCSAVKLFRRAKKDTTIGELNKSYSDICKTALVPQASMLEFSNMCRVLGDQGLLKLGQSREEKLKRVTLKVDEGDITFALQGIRFFRNCLQ
ncbi:cell division control protein 6 homolog B-like [Magnolia sinica]|uniref:cell division control protein 6 homolog B-like n=1 Tax=Magnolia sinica TaxID=86752 RepID=UPI002658CBA8|nr:cell division control protein 6 homolog B-like [Magnolia sinica]